MKDRKNNKKITASIVLVSVLAVFSAVCCAFLMMEKLKPEVASDVKDALEFLYVDQSEPETTADVTQDYNSVRLMCAGDNLIYNAIYSQAEKDGSYDFSPLYAGIKSIIASADIAAVTQGSVLSEKIAPASYPYFSSPTEIGDALAAAGFSVVNQAERNIWAQGINGAKDTLEYWKSQTSVTMTGLYESKAAVSQIPIVEKNGIKLAFLGITQETESQRPGSGAYVINLGDESMTQTEIYNEIRGLIKTAGEQADAVVVFVCFDDEETSQPTESQKEIVNYLVSFGADVVIGTGTHTVQPVELINKGANEYAAVAYSLGNFVSAQTDKENMLGGIADIIITKDKETGKTVIGSISLIPTVTMLESGNENVRIIPMSDFSKQTATHGISGFTPEFADGYYTDVVGDYVQTSVKATDSLVKAAIKKRKKDEESLTAAASAATDASSGAADTSNTTE